MAGARTLRMRGLGGVFSCFLPARRPNRPEAVRRWPGDLPSFAGVGEASGSSATCRSDLSCDSASKPSVAGWSVIPGRACMLPAECIAGNYCTQQGACAPSGNAEACSGCSQRERLRARVFPRAHTGPTGAVPGCGSDSTWPHLRGQTAHYFVGWWSCERYLYQSRPTSWGLRFGAATLEGTTAKVYFHVPRATDTVAASAHFYKLCRSPV